MVPKINRKTKQTKRQSTCKTKPKRNKHLKVEDTYTHMPKRAYNHKFTKLSYVHTNITKLKLNIRHYYVIRKRATTFFFLFFYFFHSMSQSNSQNGKLKNIKKTWKKNKKTIMTVNLPFAQCVRVLPELSQCSGKLSIGTHDSTQTGSYHKSPLCKKIACSLCTHTCAHARAHTHTHTHTHIIMHGANCITKKQSHATGTVGLTIVQNIKTYWIQSHIQT